MAEFVDFEKVIDELDEKTLREFQGKLLEHDCYQGLLNPNEVSKPDEPDLAKLRKDVKVGVQGAGYEKLKDIGPDSIKKEIEAINNEPVIVHEVNEIDDEIPPPDKDEPETKEKCIQEIIHITSFRKPGIGIPEQYRERYGEILKILNEKYQMTQLDIQKATSISNKTIAKIIAKYKEEHPIINKPDDRVVNQAGTKVALKLTAKVTEEADKTIEEDMELAIHIRETYLKEAYLRGIGLMELVDTAIPIWFGIDNIYELMMNMERENLTLKEQLKALEAENVSLLRRNVNLNRILISV